MCTTLEETVALLQETIYTEAASIFGHLHHKRRQLVGQRTKLSIQLIEQKNLLLAQIKSSSLPEQQAALTHLLLNVKCRIRSLSKAEKTRKHRWLMKKVKNEFKPNLTKKVKIFLIPNVTAA